MFVLLGHGFGATSWQHRFSAGLIPGVNEQLPYGYFRAEDVRWSIRYSEDKNESLLTQVSRRSLQRFIGFDLIHAWRNRRALLAADIVWTHTERENLAALFLKRVSRRESRPAVIAQCIWLFDLWPNLPRWKQRLYRRLLSEADLITTLSLENQERARSFLQNKDCRLVMFGVGSVNPRVAARLKLERPIKVLALGNDMHRDWDTLIEAFGGRADYDVRIASKSVARSLVKGLHNVSVEVARTAQDSTALYRWADLMVVPLKENLHASGITALLEATLFGLPVVCTDVGGLRTYFTDEQVFYVPIADSRAMRKAVDTLTADDALRRSLVSKAQERILSADLTAQGFADQHRKLSETILFGTPAVVSKSDSVISNGSRTHAAEEDYAHASGIRR